MKKLPSDAGLAATTTDEGENRMSLQDYLGTPPVANNWRMLLSLSQWNKRFKRFFYLISVPYLPFCEDPILPKSLPEPPADYKGIEVAFPIIKEQSEAASARRDKLEEKAERVLAILYFLVPLVGSLIMFLLQTTGVALYPKLTITLFLVITVLLLSGFVAAFRAGSIKNWQALGIETYFDCEQTQWKSISQQYYARGLVYCSAYNESMNDLVADFVRSARLHVFLAVLLLAIGTASLSLAVRPSQDEGREQTNKSISALATSVDALTAAVKPPPATIPAPVASQATVGIQPSVASTKVSSPSDKSASDSSKK